MVSARTAATVVLGLVAACTSTPPPTTPAPSTPPPTGSPASPAPAPTAVDLVRLGSSCADGVACPDGISCKAYYGFAGASGPEFKTCEIRCDEDKTACPAGTKCITIADGAGTVCRRDED